MVQKLFYGAFGLLMGCSAMPQPGVRAAHSVAGCEGGVVNQDAELARYTGCRVVAGHLDVRGVTSLAPLHALERVDGTLRIERTDRLYSLTGLERLRSDGHSGQGALDDDLEPARTLSAADRISGRRGRR